MNAILNKKSIRTYKNIRIDEIVGESIRAGMQAPSAENEHP